MNNAINSMIDTGIRTQTCFAVGVIYFFVIFSLLKMVKHSLHYDNIMKNELNSEIL